MDNTVQIHFITQYAHSVHVIIIIVEEEKEKTERWRNTNNVVPVYMWSLWIVKTKSAAPHIASLLL